MLIYNGELPDMLCYESGLQVESSNQVMLSTFEQDGKKRYYLVNLSTVYDNEVSVSLGEGNYQMNSLENTQQVTGTVKLTLAAGEGVYLVEL